MRSDSVLRKLARWALGAALIGTGIGHLTFARDEFQAQVPSWFPVDADTTVVVSGLVELALAAGLLFSRGRKVPLVGGLVAAFFVAIFPGNVAQYLEGTDMYGLNSDAKRLGRLFGQPVLIAWALWSTGAWSEIQERLADRP